MDSQMTAAPARTTRLKAIGRFQRERMEMKLRTQEERSEYLAHVVKMVTDIVLEAQQDLTDMRDARREPTATLHRDLSAFRAQLSADVRGQLDAFIDNRRTMATTHVDDMKRFRAQLARDVEDTVTSDFM